MSRNSMSADCPGVDSWGHGLTMADINAAGCCERWEAEHPQAEAEPEPEPEAEL